MNQQKMCRGMPFCENRRSKFIVLMKKAVGEKGAKNCIKKGGQSAPLDNQKLKERRSVWQ
ncbi:hypothetical protein CVU75_00755 [Candidatus Dependentiae bacterium HGW-Dependentiae-1]|nr:MAG: hypothetical protein CVU75_00755 [Candidatus Dependentiae bacterium HGW-Dependentiae-1]